MASSIEQIILDMEKFIDEESKPATFSSTKIVINRDDLYAFIEELKATTPKELRRYQQIINNRESILEDARKKAEEIISEAHTKNDELVSQHEIMQQAYAQANKMMMISTKEAQKMLDNAATEANSLKTGAVEYTDDLLSDVESVLSNSVDVIKERDEVILGKLSKILTQVVSNRSELKPNNIIVKDDKKNINGSTDSKSSGQHNKANDKDKTDLKKEIPTLDTNKSDTSHESPKIDVPEGFFKNK